ncbi:DUF881 domain-containing protein [Nocardioides donggukensis]|uniref:DUF881 domain-containing protein n=1 Tax=Nocardioides donggukensis TaxID=2774019 RepID=A0A927PZT1_9ACTN|nr:DUF881 domain-containing protein [Nocardioides donggukensis]MBD8868007.1 DUF881 domain-containing protein [Nocardioides donggukensis]
MPPEPDDHRAPRRRWRFGTPLVFALSGALFVASAASSEGTDLRPGRTTDLAGLVQSESENVAELEARAADLSEQVDQLSRTVQDTAVKEAQREAGTYRGAAGFEEVTGEGLTVVLADAPREVRESSEENINLLIVHQQDIQAVVNSMWQSGAEAITIQGQRIISTTGIKCSGNSVELQGIPYPQPYVIKAVGDADRLQAGIDTDPYLISYRSQAANPDIAVGWDMAQEPQLTAPAYEGIRALEHAEPVA